MQLVALTINFALACSGFKSIVLEAIHNLKFIVLHVHLYFH